MRLVCSTALACSFGLMLWGGDRGRADHGDRWWGHVQHLASVDNDGRLAGSPGDRKAAEYIAAELGKAGVRPAGVSGYLQPVKLFTRRLMEQYSELGIVRNDGGQTLKLGDDAIVDLQADPAPATEAEMVFLGYGIGAADSGYDDTKGMDLHGKIAVILAGGPSEVPASVRAHYQSIDQMHKSLRERAGVFGILTIPNPHRMDIPWSRIAANRNIWAMGMADRLFEQDDELELSVVLNPERAGARFEGTGHKFEELVALADAGKPLPRFALNAKLRSHIAIERHEGASQNVIGVLEGSDPKLKDEYVAVTAHIDHLGDGHPGALDSAAGAAALLDLAQMMHEPAARPKRSVLFVFTAAGEHRLLGSKFFLQYPTVERRQIVAAIGVDRILPLSPLKTLAAAGWSDSDLAARVQSAAGKLGIKAAADPEEQRNSFARGDQYTFALKGIPAIALKPGYEPGSAEERGARAWVQERDRSASDDVNQPVDKAAASHFDDALLEVVCAIGDGAQRPRWSGSSFFARFAR